MKLTRRETIVAAGLNATWAAFGSRVEAAPPGDRAAYRDAILHALPSDGEIWNMEKRLAGWAPHFTGSASHVAYVAMLAGQLEMAGIPVQRQTFRFPYWEPHRWSLAVDGQALPVTGYRPHSGPTGPDGVEGALALANSPDLTGKIVLVDIPVTEQPPSNNEVVGLYPEQERAAFNPREATPLSSGMGSSRDATVVQVGKSGATGAIYIWEGISDADAQDQMQPFFGPPSPIPTIWVGAETGRKLKAMIGRTARLTLYATVHDDTPTDTIWGVLPGATDDVVIVNTHSDGCNACEENGGIAVVSLARALGKLPRSQRLKTYVFLLTTGHFSHGFIKGAESWQKENADLMKRAVACLTIEHLGATEWRDDAKGQYRPTGQFEWANAITPTQPMTDIVMGAASSLNVQRVVAIRPKGRLYPGEGSSFWHAGVPTLSYIVGPNWTMAAPKGGELDKISRYRMLEEIKMFARCLERIDNMDRASFKA